MMLINFVDATKLIFRVFRRERKTEREDRLIFAGCRSAWISGKTCRMKFLTKSPRKESPRFSSSIYLVSNCVSTREIPRLIRAVYASAHAPSPRRFLPSPHPPRRDIRTRFRLENESFLRGGRWQGKSRVTRLGVARLCSESH